MESKVAKKSYNVNYQYFAATSANLLVLGSGAGLAWFTMSLPLLQSYNTPIESGPLTTAELSWAGSLILLGSLFGNLCFGSIVRIFGSKNSTLLLGIPQAVNTYFII